MNKKIIPIFIAILSFSLCVKSQERKLNFYPNLAVDLGGAIPFPLSDIPDGAGGTPKPYPSLGIGSEYNLNEKWQVALEMNYHLIAFSATANVISQAYYPGNGDVYYYSGRTETDVELRMIEFPLLAIYKMNKGRRFLMGFYYSRILEGRFETKGINGVYSPDKSITDNTDGIDITDFTIPYDFNDDILPLGATYWIRLVEASLAGKIT